MKQTSKWNEIKVKWKHTPRVECSTHCLDLSTGEIGDTHNLDGLEHNKNTHTLRERAQHTGDWSLDARLN